MMPRFRSAAPARLVARLAVAAMAGVSLAGAAGAQPVALSSLPPLRPGDAVQLAVWELPALSGEIEVGYDGRLRHPLYNRLQVAGLPVDSVRALLVAFLRDFQREPLVEFVPLVRVVVGGEVRTPGVFRLPPEASVVDAVARAGGLAPQARDDRLLLERGGRRIVVYPRAVEQPEEARQLRSGDLILLERRRGSFTQVLGVVAPLVGAITGLVLITRGPR
jgi:protein involved in polysaccharide export with SLBB domain